MDLLIDDIVQRDLRCGNYSRLAREFDEICHETKGSTLNFYVREMVREKYLHS